MKGLIILEGPDGSGKTTLAEYFVREHNAYYIHCTYEKDMDMFAYFTDKLNEAIGYLEAGHLVIIDRLWMSEEVYAKVFRGGTKWPYAGRLFDRIILKYSGIYVLCIPGDLRAYLNAYNDLKQARVEMYDTMESVYLGYTDLWLKCVKEKWPHVATYNYQTEGNNLALVAQDIFALLKEQEYVIPPASKFSTSGNLAHADIMVLDADFTKTGDGHPTFHRNGYTPANVHFNAVLELAGVPEYKLLWGNTTDEKVWQHLLSTYDLKPICLGIEAYQMIVKDAAYYKHYGQPDCHVTPERDIGEIGATTFMSRMIHQMLRVTGRIE